jgi:hypothetical protein
MRFADGGGGTGTDADAVGEAAQHHRACKRRWRRRRRGEKENSSEYLGWRVCSKTKRHSPSCVMDRVGAPVLLLLVAQAVNVMAPGCERSVGGRIWPGCPRPKLNCLPRA